MRIHILSDLHLEFAPFTPSQVEADVVVLAGDLHTRRNGLKWIRTSFPKTPVVYVLGNHEFYHDALPRLTKSMRRGANDSEVHVLENAVFELNGFAFLGCTLWTDFRLAADREAAMRQADKIMSDFWLISKGPDNQLLTPEDTARLCDSSISWLHNELGKHNPARTIVVTHHAPSAKSIAPYHQGNVLNGAFASNLETLIEQSGIPLWIHGHTHHNVDYRIGATRVVSNQRGYPHQLAPGFDPSMVVEL